MTRANAPRFDQLARRLAQREAELRDEIAAKREQSAGVPTDVRDQKDQADAQVIGDVAEREIERDLDELRQIEAALRRIDSGRYGVCVDCGQPIASQRLTAQPWVARCAACQTAAEQRQQRGAAPR
jgi:DnaK suppressor protein